MGNQSIAGGFRARFITPPSDTVPIKFEVYKSGTNEQNKSIYLVESGFCFKTFSYDTGTLVGISGLNSGFEWEKDAKVYLEFDVLPNLQVSGGKVCCTKVGKDSKDANSKEANVEEWPDFPNMFRIVPPDEVNSDGLITKRTDGKRQSKAYLLLATRGDDKIYTNGAAPSTNSEGSIYQKNSSNIIMMISQVSGVPVVFPMPWFNSLLPTDNATV
jgi:hypothetical protein